MTGFDDVLGRVKDKGYRRTKTVDLFDPALIDRHAALESELRRAIDEDTHHNRTPKAPEIARAIEALEAEIESSALSLKFGAVSYREWADLLAAHPPTKKQIKEAADRGGDWRTRQLVDHNPDTFPAALVAACALEPEMTVEQVQTLADELGPDQFSLLWLACLEINRGGEAAPKSVVAGAILRLSERSDDTPAPGESLAASS